MWSSPATSAAPRRWPRSWRRSAGIPDDAWVVRSALVIECRVDQALEIIARPPAEQEFGLGVVEHGRMVLRGHLGRRVAARLGQILAHRAVVDRLVRADM